MIKHGEQLIWFVLALILLLILGGWVVNTWRNAAEAADQSAQAELAKEIWDQLAVIPPGQTYPKTLSELRLTYPDGGDSSLLSRFEYHSSDRGCTVRTVLWGEEVMRSFPVTK